MKPSILEAARGLFRLPKREKGSIDPKASAACLLARVQGLFVASLKQYREVKHTHIQTNTDTNEREKKRGRRRRRRNLQSSYVTHNINRQVINGEGRQAETGQVEGEWIEGERERK